MKIKRFFAADIRQAIKMVRDELGPDAVILSNRRVDGGVEIVSAVDYDESLVRDVGEPREETAKAAPTQASGFQSAAKVAPRPSAPPPAAGQAAQSARVNAEPSAKLEPQARPTPERERKVVWSQEPAIVEMREELRTLRGLLENQLAGLAWNDMQRRYPLKVQLLQRLSKLGLSAPLCRELTNSARPRQGLEESWHEVLEDLSSRITTTEDDILTHGGVVALVGPTGVGKTTTIAKLAARHALRYGARNVALITTDSYRIGAFEQLRAYGRILDVPVRLVANDEEFNRALDDFADRRLVLIDTTGMSQRDLRLPEQLRLLRGDRAWLQTYLVLSTTARLSSLEEIAGVYQETALAGCILTKLDETTSLGSALSAVIQHKLPIAYVSDGQRVPEDLHTARAGSLVERAVAIMQQHEGLLEEELFTNVLRRSAADAHA